MDNRRYLCNNNVLGIVLNNRLIISQMIDITDEEIAARVQKGDTESFGALVERYGLKMSRYGRKFLSDGRDIEDLVQEIFIKAYVNIQSFNANMKFSPWLYRIAHNEFINAMKKKSRMPLLLFDFDAIFPHLPSGESADKEINDKEIKNMLDKCLINLDPKYREPLILNYLEEMNYGEIAEILHIPISTVGVRLSRGKIILKKIFREKYPNYI